MFYQNKYKRYEVSLSPDSCLMTDSVCHVVTRSALSFFPLHFFSDYKWHILVKKRKTYSAWDLSVASAVLSQKTFRSTILWNLWMGFFLIILSLADTTEQHTNEWMMSFKLWLNLRLYYFDTDSNTWNFLNQTWNFLNQGRNTETENRSYNEWDAFIWGIFLCRTAGRQKINKTKTLVKHTSESHS